MKSGNPRINNIFSIKKTKHGMDWRKYDKFEVKFAKTNRLKNSSIPYIQRILDSENLEFEKQELKRKMKIYEEKNIEKKIKVF